jgi:hypothetical protein
MSIPDNEPAAAAFTAFAGDRQIAHGDLAQIARAAHAFADAGLIVFEDATGRVVDLDLRGSADEAVARLASPTPPPKPTRGRPKLGVTAREVTLLPRHWEWLATQPGGASAALRRLVEDARRQSDSVGASRQAQEAAYRVMTTLAGNLPHYEEALRALFSGDGERLSKLIAAWPQDISAYVAGLALQPDIRR